MLNKIIQNFKNNYKLYILNFLIILLWSSFIYLHWITIGRLLFFFLVLFFIFIYKYLYNFIILKKNKIKIYNKFLLKTLLYFNKYRNPLLLLLIKIEEFMFKSLYYYDYQFLKYLFFIIFLFIINPLKIFFYKFHFMLFNLNAKKYNEVLLNRMLGLVLSVLIFTNIIFYLKYFLDTGLLGLIYIYLLIVSICSELKKNEVFLNLYIVKFLINYIYLYDFSLYNLISIKLYNSVIYQILNYNNIDCEYYYYNNNIRYIIEKFKIGNTWLILNSVSYYYGKPSYWFYFDLRSFLDYYLEFVSNYIYMEWQNWDYTNLNKIEFNGKLNNFNQTDYEKSKFLYKFDYKIFKLLLFMVYDLEDYLNSDLNNIVDVDIELFNHISSYKSSLYPEGFNKIIKNKLPFTVFDVNILMKIKPKLLYLKRLDDWDPVKNIVSHKNTDYDKLYWIFPDTEVKELKQMESLNFSEYLERNKKYKKYFDDLVIEWSKIQNRQEYYKSVLEDLDRDLILMKKLASNL